LQLKVKRSQGLIGDEQSKAAKFNFTVTSFAEQFGINTVEALPLPFNVNLSEYLGQKKLERSEHVALRG